MKFGFIAAALRFCKGCVRAQSQVVHEPTEFRVKIVYGFR